MNKYFLLISVVYLISCQQKYTPKPEGFSRIDLPIKEKIVSKTNNPFVFEQPIYSEIKVFGEDESWFNLEFDSFNGILHMSYKALNNDLNDYTEDSRELAYKHAQVAEAISEQRFVNDSLRVFGNVYSFQGKTATPLQFYLTDSLNHFVRGALYFNTPINDSIKPISIFIKDDIYDLIESWRWK